MRERNLWLLNFENPLTQRFSAEFFRSIPRVPGVYLFLGASDEVLYVGKAKDLRARLRSYRLARPDDSSRKTLRMISLARKIEWRELPGEKEALLEENALIRLHRPPFNTVNKSPESYFFVGFSVSFGAFEFFLTTESPPRGARGVFGVFKGRGRVRDAYCALLRLLWAAHQPSERFEFPMPIAGTRTAPKQFRVPLPPDLPVAELKTWRTLIERFLRGTSDRLLAALAEAVLRNETLHPFLYTRVQEDLVALKEFYAFGPRRTRALGRLRDEKSPRALVGQQEIDDLLVHARFAPRKSREPLTADGLSRSIPMEEIHPEESQCSKLSSP